MAASPASLRRLRSSARPTFGSGERLGYSDAVACQICGSASATASRMKQVTASGDSSQRNPKSTTAKPRKDRNARAWETADFGGTEVFDAIIALDFAKD